MTRTSTAVGTQIAKKLKSRGNADDADAADTSGTKKLEEGETGDAKQVN